jgi:hypothetical protein
MLPAISQPDFVPFNFEGIKLQEACFINGNPYFTRKAIGEFLEYPHPQKAIDNIVARNPHISDRSWSTALNLRVMQDTGDGTKYGRELAMEVYDPIGLQLIIFESRQPKAIQYKIAAAHLVYAFMKGEIRPSKWAAKGDRLSAIKQILSHPPTQKRRQLVIDMAQREQISLATAYRWIDKLGGLKTQKGTKKQHNKKAA